MWLILIVLRNLHIKYELSRTKDKGVMEVSFGYHGSKVTIAIKYMAHHDEAPYQMSPQYNLRQRFI